MDLLSISFHATVIDYYVQDILSEHDISTKPLVII